VAGVGDAVGGAVDLIKFPKTVSTAIRRYNLGSKLQTVSKLAKVSGALAIVGGTITAVTEFRRAQQVRRKEGMTEQAGIAYANAAAGLLSAAAGAMLFVPGLQPLAPVAFAISSVIQGATWLYANRKRIKKGIAKASKTISNWASKARAKLSNAFRRRSQAIGQATSAVRTKLASRFSAIRGVANRTSKRVMRAAKGLFSPLRKVASRVKNAAAKFKKSPGNLFKRRAKPRRAKPRGRTVSRRSRRILRRSRSIRGWRQVHRTGARGGGR
jgi:uncharacterized phage infection (PIP) family protein YhgE